MTWLDRFLIRALGFLGLHNFARGYEALGPWSLLKSLEIRLLKSHSSTFCYGKPDTVFLELTNTCNLACSFCYRFNPDLMNPGKGFIAWDDFTRVALQLRGTRRLYLCWGGESSLHPRLADMVAFISKNRISSNFGFVTNGMRLDAALGQKLLEAGLRFLVFSLDGGDAQMHESYRKNASFDQIIRNLEGFCKANRDAGSPVRVEICSVLTKENVDSLRKIPDIVRGFGIYRWTVQDICERTEDSKGLRPSAVLDFDRTMEAKCKGAGIRFWHCTFQPITRCIQPFRNIGITWDGKITPCCNIENESFSNSSYALQGFWNGPFMRSWRKRMLRRDFPSICRQHCVIDKH